MNSFNKIVMSVATAAVLATGLNAATSNYVPLATDTNDNAWKLFGVDGVFGVGGASTFSNGANYATLTDGTADTIAVDGIPITTGAVTGNMMSLKALSGTTDDVTAVTINVNTSPDDIDLVFSETEAMRTMFIALGNSTQVANVMVSYKASMEGDTIQVQRNGVATTTYQFTLASANTYDNPQTTVPKTAGGGTGLSELDDALDYDFSDNPKTSSYYDQDTHQTLSTEVSGAAGETRLYSYDAATSTWLIYDSNNAIGANDFTGIEKAKGYWGKMDIANIGNILNANDAPGGIVLGDASIESTDYDLNPGWNLLSYSSTKPDIRSAATGLVLTVSTAAVGNLALRDYTGVNQVGMTLPVAGDAADWAIQINKVVEAAQERGDFSDTFDLKAIPVSATQIALLSNKRFTVIETADTAGIEAVDTVAGGDPWDVSAAAVVNLSAGDLFDQGADGVDSVYGEYMLAVQPLIGADTATSLDAAIDGVQSAAIQINANTANLVYLNDDGDAAAVDLTNAAIGNFDTALQAETTGNAKSWKLNVDYDLVDNATDWVLLASESKFYIRDYTFTRVVEHGYSGAAAGTALTFVGTLAAGTAASITDSSATVLAINANSATHGVFAHDDGATEFITMTSASLGTQEWNLYDDDDIETIQDKLNLTTNITKGAIAKVSSVEALGRATVVSHSFDYDPDIAGGENAAVIDTATDTLTVILTGVDGVAFAGLDVLAATITTDPLAVALNTDYALFELMVTGIRTSAKANGLDLNVYHNCETDDSNAELAVITVEGYSVTGVSYEFVDFAAGNSYGPNLGVEQNTLPGTFTMPSDLTQNLQYNAVYTPDFATDGPLYTIKELGYTISSLVTGSTDMSDGSVAWDSIDLTRDVADMFDNQDFNLFQIDPRAGYWTYLEANAVSDVNDLNVTILGAGNETYIHHFNADGTTENHVSANFTVVVDGLPADTTPVVVYANVGGSTIHLTSSLDDGQYTGNLTSYEVDNIRNSSDVTVTVSDGMAWKTTSASIKTIDVTKPSKPIVNSGSGDSLTVTKGSADTINFYVFDTAIPESALESDTTVMAHANYIAKMDANSSTLSFCANDNIVFGNTYNLLIAGIDNGGIFGAGNVSDLESFDFAPATKNSNVLTHVAGSGVATENGLPYDANCTATTLETTDRGVSVKAVTAGVTAKLAFEVIDGANFSLDIPYTIYVKDADDNMIEIKYVSVYGAQTPAAPIYVQIDDGTTVKMYEIEFETDDSVYGDTTSAYTLVPATDLVSGQTF